MARTGIDFAESCMRHMARSTADELASRLRVTRDPSGPLRYIITCGNRSATAFEHPEPVEFARDIQNAVETVMGLREPKEAT